MLLSILIFIGVLSFLVFVHELGHFLAAKACGIYVDQFSVGMPPRIFGFKWGETDYCVGALPIGGYVKMAGQEDAPLSEEERESTYGRVPEHRWFNKKPYWQKLFVLFAGPFMNLVIALVLYTIVAAVERDVTEAELSAKIGRVEAESSAARAPLYPYEPGKAFDSYGGVPAFVGWETGDVVLAIDERPLERYHDLVISAVLSKAGDIQYALIEREAGDGSAARYISKVTMAFLEEGDDYPRYGVTPFRTVLVVEIHEGMAAEAAGLEVGDIVTHVDGKRVGHTAFFQMMEEAAEGTEVTLGVLRKEARLEVPLTPGTIGRLRGIGLKVPKKETSTEIEVAFVEEKVKEASGLLRKDKIVAVNGEPMTHGALLAYQKEHPGGKLTLSIERPRILLGLIQSAKELELELDIEPVRAAGITMGVRKVARNFPVSQWIPEGYRQSVQALTTMKRILGKLFVGDVSPKQLGGPLMIGQVTSQAARFGWTALLDVTAFISINLFIMNLLPFPVLDGGQIVVNTIEAVRRKPLNQKFLEYFQFAGIILIISLMLYVTKNDVARWVEGLRP